MRGQSSFWFQYQMARFKSWFLNAAMMRLSQHLKIKRLLSHIKKNIHFYKSLNKSNFSSLPIVDKSIIQDNFSNMNAQGLTIAQGLEHPDLYVHQSAGTSGEVGTYLFSAKEMTIELASLLSKMLPVTLKPLKIGVFHLTKAPYFPYDMPHTRFDWTFFDLNQDFEKELLKFSTFAPDVIIAPVQTLCVLARMQQDKKIQIAPQKIFTTQEVLAPLAEKLISMSFEQPILPLYQCAEGWLGVTCEYGTLHMDEDQFLIEKEWIDNQRQRFIPVITTLNRYLQPLVRYRMEDILIFKSGNCPCRSPMLAVEKIVGRCEDMLYFSEFATKYGLKPIYSDNLHQAIGRVAGNIQEYQLLQYSPHHLVIKILADNFLLARHGIEIQFSKLFLSHGVKSPHLEFLPLERLPLNQTFRQTQRLAKIPL
jgi:putative adenylate-forming enzyme